MGEGVDSEAVEMDLEAETRAEAAGAEALEPLEGSKEAA